MSPSCGGSEQDLNFEKVRNQIALAKVICPTLTFGQAIISVGIVSRAFTAIPYRLVTCA